jgi:hypothetical protein
MVNKNGITILAAVIFVAVSSPATYKLTRKIIGKWVASASGCPTSSGFLLHVLVYALITRLTMGS